MKTSPTRDLIVGLFVVGGLAAVGFLSLRIGGASYAGPGGRIVYAYFDEVGGLSDRAPVVIGGVKVGQVVAIDLDPQDYRARVTLDVDASLELPEDTAAGILTQGVLGDKLVELQPGGADELLTDGGTIAHTQSAVVLERLLGKLLTSFGGSDS